MVLYVVCNVCLEFMSFHFARVTSVVFSFEPEKVLENVKENEMRREIKA